MNNAIDSIKKRYSVRTYSPETIEKDKLKALGDSFTESAKGPFGNSVRFQMIDVSGNNGKELKKFISYGNVRGARTIIAGAVVNGEKCMEDFGYCMEKVVLAATAMGLGTVWLGGSPNRTSLASEMNTAPEELIPAITPIGYAAEKRTMIDILTRTVAGSKHRKNFGQLFFDGAVDVPLDKTACGKYSEVLEAVRLAPSASNKQPWRILKEMGKNNYHFYLDENKAYNNIVKDIHMQDNDMGIAMCHFEMAARELGLEGSWQDRRPSLDAGGLVYIISWIG